MLQKTISSLCTGRFIRPALCSQFSCLARPSYQTNTSTSVQSAVLDSSCSSTSPAINHTQVRTVKYAYKPNALKRIRKHGLEKWINNNQQEVLYRKFLKGKHQLTVFDRFLNEMPKKKSWSQKRVALSNKKEGFRGYVKDQEYYRF